MCAACLVFGVGEGVQALGREAFGRHDQVNVHTRGLGEEVLHRLSGEAACVAGGQPGHAREEAVRQDRRR
nr:hypothetical protein [Microbispora sp. H10670]